MAKTTSPNEIVREYEEGVRDLAEKHGVVPHLMIAFPGHRKPPIMGRLGIWLANRYGGQIVTKYQLVDGTVTSNRSTKRRR